MGVRAPEPSRLRQDPIRYSACNDHHPIQTGGSRRLDHAPTSLCRTLPCASTSDRDQGLFDSSLRPHPSSSPHFWRFFLYVFTAFRVRMTSKERTQCGATRTGDAISPYGDLVFESSLRRIFVSVSSNIRSFPQTVRMTIKRAHCRVHLPPTVIRDSPLHPSALIPRPHPTSGDSSSSSSRRSESE